MSGIPCEGRSMAEIHQQLGGAMDKHLFDSLSRVVYSWAAGPSGITVPLFRIQWWPMLNYWWRSQHDSDRWMLMVHLFHPHTCCCHQIAIYCPTFFHLHLKRFSFFYLTHSPHNFLSIFFSHLYLHFLSVKYSVWKYFIVENLKHTCFIYFKKHHQRRFPFQMKRKHEQRRFDRTLKSHVQTVIDVWCPMRSVLPTNLHNNTDWLKRFGIPAIAIVSVHVSFIWCRRTLCGFCTVWDSPKQDKTSVGFIPEV